MTNNKKAIKILRKRQRFCKVIAEYANETVKADDAASSAFKQKDLCQKDFPR